MSAPLGKMRGKLAQFGRDASKSLAGFNAKLRDVHGGIRTIATAAAAVGTAGGLAAFAIGKTGAEFEQAVAGLGAVSLQSRDEIAALEAKAKELGATTKYTATEAANAMTLMAQAGFTEADILAGIGPVLDAAAASGLEIAEVAGHVSNALKGMGLETSEASRVADVLAVASARTNSSIGSLGESLSNVASTAREFKIPLEDTVAAVALLQDVGLDASVAGSALNTMLTQIAAPTDEVAEKMREFGVTFQDAKGNMLPFEQVLANISKAAKKSGGNMDQVAFFAELVGLRGQKAAGNLKDLFDTGKVSALTAELRGAAGAAQKMATLRMDSTIGDLTLLTSAIDGVKVALFETESGPLRSMIREMTKWVESNRSLIVFEFQVWLRRIKDNLPEIVTWLERIGVAAAAFYTLWAAVKIAQVAVGGYELAIKLAEGATWAWNTAIKLASAATWAWNAATNSATLATIGHKIAQVATRVATAISTAAQWAYSASLNASTAASVGQKIAEYAARLALVASRAATAIATAAQAAYAAALAATTGGLAAFKVAALSSATAIGTQVAAMAPLLITLGAATAAVMALVAAWDQYNKLDKDLEGSGGVSGTLGKMWEMGTFDPFKAHDAAMDEKARAERERLDERDKRGESELARSQMVSPQARAANETLAAQAAAGAASVNGKITVAAEPGTRATVAKPSKANKLPLVLEPSGAFR